MRHSFLLIAMISVSLEPKWRHFAQVNIADIFMLSSKLPKQNEIMSEDKSERMSGRVSENMSQVYVRT